MAIDSSIKSGIQPVNKDTRTLLRPTIRVLLVFYLRTPSPMKSPSPTSVPPPPYLEKWMKQVNEHAPQEVIKILVANKIDVNEEER